MKTKKTGKKPLERDQALHDATHGQFGEEPRPEPIPDEKGISEINENVRDRTRTARKKSRTI
jgi:hypothetical protein